MPSVKEFRRRFSIYGLEIRDQMDKEQLQKFNTLVSIGTEYDTAKTLREITRVLLNFFKDNHCQHIKVTDDILGKIDIELWIKYNYIEGVDK